MPHDISPVGRTLTLTAGADQEVYNTDYGPTQPVSLYVQNNDSSLAPNISTYTVSVFISEGYGGRSQITTQLGPGEASRYRVTGRVRVTAQADNINAANSFSCWNSFQPAWNHEPPDSSILIAAAPPAFVAVPPNNGWSVPYRRWLHVTSDQRYDMRIVDRIGNVRGVFTGMTPDQTRRPILLPPGFRIEFRGNAIAANATFTWSEKANH